MSTTANIAIKLFTKIVYTIMKMAIPRIINASNVISRLITKINGLATFRTGAIPRHITARSIAPFVILRRFAKMN